MKPSATFLRLVPQFLAAAVLAAPASAQDMVFDPAPTAECLAGDPAGEACIGRAAETCMEQDGGGTTVGMGFCLHAEAQWWDARLNAAFAALMEREAANDAEMKRIGATVPELASALRAMQRAWMPFRDATCAYEAAQWGGGTGQGPATAACLMHETGRQTLALEARLAEADGQ